MTKATNVAAQSLHVVVSFLHCRHREQHLDALSAHQYSERTLDRYTIQIQTEVLQYSNVFVFQGQHLWYDLMALCDN